VGWLFGGGGGEGGGGSIDRFCHTILSGPISLEQLDVVGKSVYRPGLPVSELSHVHGCRACLISALSHIHSTVACQRIKALHFLQRKRKPLSGSDLVAKNVRTVRTAHRLVCVRGHTFDLQSLNMGRSPKVQHVGVVCVT